MQKKYSNKLKSIGGYIELQISPKDEFYPNLLKLNTGRNALEYLLKINSYTLVYIPYFTCDVILEPIKRLNVQYQFYTIDDKLDPIIDFEIGPTDCLLYTNYFGIKQDTVTFLSKHFKNLIVDNSQAFFAEPIVKIDTFYSCRKFFGVPDGAYLYTINTTKLRIENDISVNRFSHLIKGVDLGIEAGYQDYINNNESLSNNPIRKMSALTAKIVSGIDYKECRYRRNSNFMYLHETLAKYNNLNINVANINGPMVYPLLLPSTGIRQKLIDKKIYVATYWPNVFDWTTKKMLENYLSNHLIPLPIDHRYTHLDMKTILSSLKSFL